MYEEVLQNLLKSCLFLEGFWSVIMRKKWGYNKKKRFYSKLWESFLWRKACENPVGLSINEKQLLNTLG